MELISIIVPIYNVEDYLVDCLENIVNQTYKNLEIILVDDGSPDNCGNICDEYAKKDNRIKVIHKENGGLSSARNVGLDIATGEYISFIDSDDFVSKDFIEKLYNLCKKNGAEIAECNFLKFVDKIEKSNINPKIESYSSIEMQKRIYSNEYIRTIVVWNKLYKKCIYETLRFPIGKINEDEFTTYKAFGNTSEKIVITNEVLYYYRYNENSIMGRKFNEKRLDVLEAYEERKEYFREKDLVELYEKTVEEYQEKLKQCYILTKENIVHNKEILKNIICKARKNYGEYKKIEKASSRSRFMIGLFIKIPKLYCLLLDLKIYIIKK